MRKTSPLSFRLPTPVPDNCFLNDHSISSFKIQSFNLWMAGTTSKRNWFCLLRISRTSSGGMLSRRLGSMVPTERSTTQEISVWPINLVTLHWPFGWERRLHKLHMSWKMVVKWVHYRNPPSTNQNQSNSGALMGPFTFSNLLNLEKHIDLLQNGPILLSSKVCLGDPKEISK